MTIIELINYIEVLEYRASNITDDSDFLYVKDLLDRFGTIKRHLQGYRYQLQNITGKENKHT